MKYLTVGELKKILEDVDDSCVVTIVSPDAPLGRHITQVNSVGYLECEYEDTDAIGFMANESIAVKRETDYCTRELFNGFEEESNESSISE